MSANNLWFNRSKWNCNNEDRTHTLFFYILLAVFTSETLIMVLLDYVLPPMPVPATIILDGALLVSILFPTLYMLILKPLLHQIAERKRFEGELEEAFVELNDRKVFIESILANMQSGIIVTDLLMGVALVNSYAARFFRKSSSELNGQRLDEIFPEVAASIEAGIDDAEVVYVRGENHPTIGFKRVALKRLDNTAAGHIITFVDISEIIKVRKEIRSKERLAAMGEVVARVAHEMRNPLFGITAAAQILAMELKFTAEQNELMTSLFNEAQRMNHMVEELLDCSKEMKLKKTTFDLIKSLNDALTFNECFMVEKNLSLQKITPDDELFVVADPERFRQVMVNILKNAVDATPHGGTITVTVGELDGTVSIQVGDTGTGIQGDIMEKIFDVFYTTKRRGTGLGLPICRKIVESHGGSLTVRNNDCSGATFTVTLPSGGIS